MDLPAFDAFVQRLTGTHGGLLVAIRITVILVVAWTAVAVLQRAIRQIRIRLAARIGDLGARKRAETVGRVLRYVVGVVIWLVAGMLVLGELGISVAPILGAAGVAGIAIGFGAQSLVKDYFTGLFILLEDQIHQGDVVKLGDHTGVVEEVTLRFVRLRDYDGNVHYVPNGQIAIVVNYSREHAFSVVDVDVAYGADLDQALAVMGRVAQQMREDPVFGPKILDPFETVGVERWADSSVVLRGRFKVAPLEQWSVRREYLKRLKQAFDAEGIEIPFPQRTLHVRQAIGAAAD